MMISNTTLNHHLPLTNNHGVKNEEDDDEEGFKWPKWLRPLLQTTFFNQCKLHAHAHKNECNMYCLDCMNGSLCSLCLSLHTDHRHVQIRRSSYHDVIRVAEIQKHMDISGIQTYVINSARIVFLNERPQPRLGKGVTNTCTVCQRSLLDSFTFCSLACKIVGTSKDFKKREVNKLVILEGYDEDEWMSGKGRNTEDHENKGQVRSFTPSTPPPTSVNYRNSKKRKGTPHRSPMGMGVCFTHY